MLRNINTDGIEIIEDGKTFFWKGKYHNDLNSRDTLITDLNVLADFKPVVPEKFIKTRIFNVRKFTSISSNGCN